MSAHEMRMCLEEATIECARLHKPRAVAPWVVDVLAPYYCKSTDAFAGNVRCASHGFNTKEEANAWIEANHDGELSYRVKGPPEPPKEIVKNDVPF